MATSKTYNISNDFPNGIVYQTGLQDEILASSGIIVALDYIETVGNSITIYFKAEIDSTSEQHLDAVVAAHTGEEPEPLIQVVRLAADPIAGMPIIQPLSVEPDASDLFKSWQLVVPPKTTVNLDIIVGGSLVGAQGICKLAAGGYKCRTKATQGSALHMGVVDRDDITGVLNMFGIPRTKLILNNVSGGTPQIGQYVVGQTTGAKSKVLAVNGNTLDITFDSGWDMGFPLMWQDGEDVEFEEANGASTGVSATFVDWVEGGLYSLPRYLEDEWIEDFEEKWIEPGGSKTVPQGLYLRVTGYNNDSIDTLRIKCTLKVGAK